MHKHAQFVQQSLLRARMRSRGLSYNCRVIFSGNYRQEDNMAEMLSPRQRPLGISIIAIITAVQGIGDIIVSLIAFFVSNATTGFVGGIATAASSIFLIVGVLTLVLACGWWTLKPW